MSKFKVVNNCGDYSINVGQVFTSEDLRSRYGQLMFWDGTVEELNAILGSDYELLNKEEKMNKNNKSDGIFTDQMIEQMGIERVLFRNGATIVFLKDGRKGTSVQSSSDEADRTIGLAMAYAYAVGTDGNKSQFRKNVEQLKKHNGFNK